MGKQSNKMFDRYSRLFVDSKRDNQSAFHVRVSRLCIAVSFKMATPLEEADDRLEDDYYAILNVSREASVLSLHR